MIQCPTPVICQKNGVNTPIAYIQEIGVVRLPSCIENFHIFLEGLRKHFLYVCRQADFQPFSIANLENFSQLNNTLQDIVFKKNNQKPTANS
jgi:hypothetical protein